MKRIVYSTGRAITFQAPSSFKVFLLPKVTFFPVHFELKVGDITLQVSMLGVYNVTVVLSPPCAVVSRRGHATKTMSSTWRNCQNWE
jgi:hypothetical protein